MEETDLPVITIDMTTTTQTTTTTAMIMESSGHCLSFFQQFVESLLTSSRVVPSKSLIGTQLQVAMEPLVVEEEDLEDESSSTSDTVVVATAAVSETDDASTIPIRIRIDGTVVVMPSASSSSSSVTTNLLQDDMSHGMVVYLTLWGTGDLQDKLKQCGFDNAEITAIHVDGRLVDVMIPDRDQEQGTGASSSSSNSGTVVAVASEQHDSATALGQRRCLLIGSLLLSFISTL